MKKMNKKGFTIVELVIVIAVIAILAAVLIPTFSNIVEKANDSTAMQEARNTYTEYLAEVNAQPAPVVYVKGGNSYFKVVDGKMSTDAWVGGEGVEEPTEGVIVYMNGNEVVIDCTQAETTAHEAGNTCTACGKVTPTATAPADPD